MCNPCKKSDRYGEGFEVGEEDSIESVRVRVRSWVAAVVVAGGRGRLEGMGRQWRAAVVAGGRGR